MTPENILEIIATQIKDVLPGLESHTFKRGDSLEALGANSVDRSEIVMMTLESLNLNIPLIQTYGPKNIGELSDLLSEKM